MIAKPYFIKTKGQKKQAQATLNPSKVKVEPLPEEKPIGIVQGRIPRSKEEWRVANALWKLQIPFRYQVDFNGGANVRGGQVIDFLVSTVPMPTPLYVQGSYYHPQATRGEEEYKQRKLRQYTRGYYAMPKEAWDYQLQTMDMAYQTMKGMFQ
jgi:hypothetical protein